MEPNWILSDAELSAMAASELNDAKTLTSQVEIDRANALRAYNQDLYGDEQANHSQVVSADVRDIIEMMLPDMVEQFVGPDAPVEFEPRSEQDEETAEQETDYVRYVYNQQNDGYLVTYTALKDMLLQKNCYVKVFWDTKLLKTRESYQGLSPDQFVLLMQDPDIEVRQHTMTSNGQPTTPEAMQAAMQQGQPQTVTHDVVAWRKKTVGQATVQNIPPERVYVSRWHNSVSLADAKAVIYEDVFMRGELIAVGYDPVLVNGLPVFSGQWTTEAQARWEKEGRNMVSGSISSDKSRDLVLVREFYLRADIDGDGQPELIKLVTGDEQSSKFLFKGEIDAIEIMSGAGIINTHKHYATAVADILQDIQRICTVVLRQTLDNVYNVNAPMNVVDEDLANENTIPDLLDRRPGGVVRINGKGVGAAAAIVPQTVPFIGDASIQILGYLDQMREERTGISRDTQGLNPDALSDSTNLVGSMIMNRAQARLKMLVRNFAETFMKPVMLRLHELAQKNDQQQNTVKLRGKWVTISPREWQSRERLIINVGTGHMNKLERLTALQAVLGYQAQAAAAGSRTVGDENVYSAFHDFTKLSNLGPNTYFTDPATLPPPKPQPNPQMEAVKVAEIEATVKAQKEAATNDLENRKHNDEMAFKYAQLNQQRDLKVLELHQQTAAHTQAAAEQRGSDSTGA